MGFSHPDHLLARLSASQLADWRAYYELEPWGDTMLDRRLASLECSYININRDVEKRPDPYEIYDFAPYLRKPEPKQESQAVISAKLREFFGRCNAGRRDG